jgi:hypothetical protein
MFNAKKNSPWLVSVISVAVFFTLAACGTQVIDGGGSGGSGGNATTVSSSGSAGNGGAGSGGNGNGGGGTAGGNPGTSNAISMLYGDLPNSAPSGTTVASSSGGGPDPNWLYIAISSTLESCTDPFAAEPCGDNYRVSLGIPPALQQVGTIALNDPSLISYFSWSGPEDGPGQCPGGGGSFIEGELEITAIDNTHVAGILTNTSTFDFDANGAFDAPRCVF